MLLAGSPTDLQTDFSSLMWVFVLAAGIPIVVGLLRIRIAEVVLLLAGGMLLGPSLLGLITVGEPVAMISEIGLGFLFFQAGLEIESSILAGRSGRLAAIGWGLSLLLAGLASATLFWAGIISDYLGLAVALTSTALGTLLPILRDAGILRTEQGRMFMAAGAVGEFGPILGMSLVLGGANKFTALGTLVAFGLIALLLAWLPRFLATRRLLALLSRGHETSSQTSVRLVVLLLIFLLTLTGRFGLDVVLGAFVAGLIVRRFAPPEQGNVLHTKVEGIAYGFFIPVFFVVSGALIDIGSVVKHPVLLIACFVLLFLCRGLPQLLVYRRAIPDLRDRWRFSLYVATGLPIIIAVTTLEVANGTMSQTTAASLVGAGALTVLVFPTVARLLERRQDRAAATA